MKNDMVEVMEACVEGRLDEIDLQFEDNEAVCVENYLGKLASQSDFVHSVFAA